MLAQALINVLGVATWYILGIAYTSTASRYWPQKESFRGKWTPRDVREELDEHPPITAWDAFPAQLRSFIVIAAFLMFLTVWPIAVYHHAKRKFRTQKDAT